MELVSIVIRDRIFAGDYNSVAKLGSLTPLARGTPDTVLNIFRRWGASHVSDLNLALHFALTTSTVDKY